MKSSPDMAKDNNKNEPLVSIIVITYNSAKFVLETLESAKAQTYENIELIVSDDASTDDTVEICLNWLNENKDRFVRTELITVPENTGIPANCNRGLHAAKGEWVKFIAGDDALMPGCIFDNVNYIKSKTNITLLASKAKTYLEFFIENNFISEYPTEEIITSFFHEQASSDQQYNALLRKNVINANSVFIKKSIIIEAGYFDEEFKLIEDYPMWLKLTRNGHKVHFMNSTTVLYRMRNDSLSLNVNKGLFNNSLCVYEKVRKKYVYPYISAKDKMNYKYLFFTSVMLQYFLFNKKSRITYYITRLVHNKLNPFTESK
jgi:glycosyltransferase involved in cell wall biosynthesis